MADLGNPVVNNASQAPTEECSDCRDARSVCTLAHISQDGVLNVSRMTFIIGLKKEIKTSVSAKVTLPIRSVVLAAR